MSMPTLTARDFELVSAQAVLFTPGHELPAEFGKDFAAEHRARFDGESFVIPQPEQVQLQLPRLILRDMREIWHWEIGSAQTSIQWRKDVQGGAFTAKEFVDVVREHFYAYLVSQSPRVGRVGLVLRRYAVHEEPGHFLSEHFCRADFRPGGLDDPASFELHVRTQKVLEDGRLQANIWTRNKTGVIATGQKQGQPIVLVEQDINTLADDSDTINLSVPFIEDFFDCTAITSLEAILDEFYPAN